MREYLFRGKRKNRDEWVEGDLVHFTQTRIATIDTHKNGQPWRGYDVIPESVGMWTGLLDMDGRKIFEGDLLSWTDEEGQSYCFTVKWNNERQAYWHHDIKYGWSDPFDEQLAHECTVIGNTYDYKITGGDTNGIIQF